MSKFDHQTDALRREQVRLFHNKEKLCNATASVLQYLAIKYGAGLDPRGFDVLMTSAANFDDEMEAARARGHIYDNKSVFARFNVIEDHSSKNQVFARMLDKLEKAYPHQYNRETATDILVNEEAPRNSSHGHIYHNGLSAIYNVKDDGTGTETVFDLVPTLVAASLAFSTPEYVNAVNQKNFCGSAGWAVGVKKSVLGLTYDGTEFKTKESDRITVYINADGTLSAKAPGETQYFDYRR